MAHHKRYQLNRSNTDCTMFPVDSRPVASFDKNEEEEVADLDEPPDSRLTFMRKSSFAPCGIENQPQTCPAQSLLTKALLTSPNLKGVSPLDTTMTRAQSTTSTHSAISGMSTMDLTSDGEFTSPARTTSPSPPLPSTFHHALPLLPSKGLDALDHTASDTIKLPPPQQQKPAEPPKRHITFACAGPKEQKAAAEPKKTGEEPPKRKCMLRFACPSKPTHTSDIKSPEPIRPKQSVTPPMINTVKSLTTPSPKHRHRDSESTVKDETEERGSPKSNTSSPKMTRSEALRFHEFAAAKPEEENWILEKPSTTRQKITVTDTLRKENAIRKLGEEAEEEALEEEKEEDEALENDDDDEDEDEDDDEEDVLSDEDVSDDGNETDDEHGFADSDEESEADSEYQFWTPAVTTAATSVDHLEHIRPIKTHRSPSESSIDSMVNASAMPIRKPHHGRPRRGSPRMRPGTPELPDSTDFVCGTLDEDRPLEQAYLSCMEQRRIAKHGVLPQDVDPSFPTSDLDEEDEDDEDEEEIADGSDSHAWVMGKPDESDDGSRLQRSRASSTRKPMAKSPAPSPKRMRSPAPKRRNKSPAPAALKPGHAARSPPPRRLFGHSPKRMRSPPRNLRSPPCSRRGSLENVNPGIHMPTLAARPQLTHTKSLPRTPNPFWTEHNRGRLQALRQAEDDEADSSDNVATEIRRRGPIDIVQGLERRRQRRKDKLWKAHCRQAAIAKESQRRCARGKGVERMREVGLEYADRCKGYGQRLQLILSI